ncbi:cell division protein FtsQ/DivIB, partial [Saccharomonospora iraqiensis]|uniref:cell division protein FtsQ/DivIB n=1 Tax=Saccharomonospora iraqiensis TaxID=52698 RepID=UPI001F29EB34
TATGARGRGRSRQQVAMRRRAAVLSVLTVVGLGYVLLFTPTLGVRSVEVVGVSGAVAADIRSAADVPRERPMLRVDTDAVAGRVAALPEVAEVAVTRSWPSTLTVTVRERVAVAYHVDGTTVSLVDTAATPFKRVDEAPAGLPRFEHADPSPDDPASRAAATVLASLPPELSGRVTAVRAATPGDVRFDLGDGSTVRWGDAEQNRIKARVLSVLLTRDGSVYDVASPELPTVS